MLHKSFQCFDEVKNRAGAIIREQFGSGAPLTNRALHGKASHPPSIYAANHLGLSHHPLATGLLVPSSHLASLPLPASSERRLLDEAIAEAMDGRAEAQRVEAAIREAEAHQKKLEWEEALDKIDVALRLAHRAKPAMKIKVLTCQSSEDQLAHA